MGLETTAPAAITQWAPMSASTVAREWRFARAWLAGRLGPGAVGAADG